MADLDELYQELILDHTKHPRNFGKLEVASHKAVGDNPLCGDRVAISLKIDNGLINDICFEGKGCAISTASASMMTEFLKGKKVEEFYLTFDLFHNLVTGKLDGSDQLEEIGKLIAFRGVADFPIRVKCATLAWHTFKAAIDSQEQLVTTE